jgi:glycerophosphoryl diester phosphodiesterase
MERPRRRLARRLVAVLAVLGGAYLLLRCIRPFEPVAPRAYLSGPRVLNIAHRGAAGHGQENTLAAFHQALALGADVLELDVHPTRDGRLVVVHDAAPAGVGADVASLPLGELRRRRPDIPTLEEVFRAFPGRRINIELKRDEPDMTAALAGLIATYRRHDSVLVAASSHGVLRAFRARTGGRVATSASAREVALFSLCWATRIPCRPAYAALQVPVFLHTDLPSFIAFAHRHGLAVHYWTVNREDDMERLVRAGADGLISDHPERVRKVLHPQPPR